MEDTQDVQVHTLEARVGKSLAVKLPGSFLTRLGWLVSLEGDRLAFLLVGTREVVEADRADVVVVKWRPEGLEEAAPDLPSLGIPQAPQAPQAEPPRGWKGGASTAQKLMAEMKRRAAAQDQDQDW